MHEDLSVPALFAGGYFTSADLRGTFRRVGENVSVAASCVIVGADNIEIGGNVRIDDFCTIIATGPVVLGSHIHIGGYSMLGGRGGITMEDFSGLSQGVRIYTASDDYSGATMTNPTVPEAFTGVKVKPVTIGRHAIVGSGSVILPGCDLGEGAAVGALSLVTHRLKPWGIYSGAPARHIRDRSRDLLALEAKFHHVATV